MGASCRTMYSVIVDEGVELVQEAASLASIKMQMTKTLDNKFLIFSIVDAFFSSLTG